MKKTTFSIILVCSLLFGFGYQGISQAYMVKRGERPTIDLNQVPKEAYEHNTIIIKLAESQDKAIETLTHSSGKQAVALFGIAQVDQLNMQYAVQSVMPHFATNATVSKFTERHKAWGFHRWFKLELEESDDIVSIVMAYRSLPEVEWAEPVYKKRLIAPVGEEVLLTAEADPKGAEWFPNDPRFNEQWHYHNTGQQGGTAGRDIDLPEAWEIETGNSDVIVAVIDEGVQYTHPELAGNMWDGIGFNFVNNTSNVVPGNHGTHVAGTIAAENDNNLGVSGIAGGTGSGDGVRIMSCQVFQGYSNGGFHIAPVWAADNGASISQNSWGYSYAGTFEQSVLDAIDYFNANGGGDALDGGITIFAAGNDDSQGQWYPGCYSGAFAIAATNNQDKRSWYSNYDTWVDISAPGGETNTVTERGVLSTLTSNSYGFYQGTSMACPHASGVAALMISMAYGLLSNEDVAEILRTTTDDHYDVNPSYIGKLGTGRLNALNALLETQNYLTGVTNPRSFKATGISTNTIELEWNLNPDNNNVLILWSADGTFGELQDGTTYNVGQAINGGGIVLYKGNNTEYTHNGLEANTKYFYKAFSFNAENTYSSGKITYAWTQCDILTELPYFQDFNESASLPNCWDIQDNQGNGQVWAFGTISGGLTGTTGNYAYLDSDGFGSGNTQNADLISPLFDLSEYMEVEIEFKHYFRSYSNNVVSFHYSIDGGNTWTQVESWSATTSNPANFTVTIDELTGQSNVLLKWNYTGSWGYYWCVDDVSITGESNIPGAPTTVTNPNPSNNAVNVATDGQLSWSWGNNTNKYDLWFGTANNMQLVVSQADAGSQGTTGSYSYSNLQTNTIYQWQLVSYNTNIGMEKNGPVWSFRTEFDVINPPYFEDFEAEFPPLGWTIYDVDGSPNVRTWEVSTAQNHTPGGNRSAFHNYGPSSQIEDGWLVTPKLALPANSGINLSFWNYNTFPSWYEKNSVLISAGDGTPQTGNFVELWSPASITSAWTETNIDLSVYAGQEVYIAFRYQGSNAHAWHVDDVEFSLTVAEPVININPMQLNETLSTGQTSVKQLTVSNTGAADLEFQIEVTTEQKNIRLLPVIQQDYSKAPIHFDWSSIEFQKANKQSNNSAPAHITDEEIIRYDNGINDDAIGLTNGGTFEVAAYWPASAMAQYVNMQLEKVEVYINDVPSSAVIKIYGQGTSSSPGALLYSQSFSSTPDTWITVELDTPVGITGS
ncbi:MAG: S8 family serine peptidase, partial [Bacteroidales bacterium]|nr:S8 family serine peptidase [Bacteroidales bacterium]